MKIRLLRLLGALISGLGMALTLPPYDIGGLVWVVLLPLLVVLWSVKGKRPVQWYGKCGGDVPTPEEVMTFLTSLAG